MAENDGIFHNAMIQGHSAAWDQEWSDAADLYRKAVEQNPSNPMAITSLGLALYELKKYSEALVCYKRAAKISPEDPLSIEKMADIYQRMDDIDQAIDSSMQAADLHLKIRDAEKAIENWKRVTKLDPKHLKAHSRLAVVQDRLGRKQQAIQEYITLAAYLQEFGQVGEALQAVKKAVESDPNNVDAQEALKLIENNKTLPKPTIKQLGTGLEDFDSVLGIEDSSSSFHVNQDSPNPVAEARQKALIALAGLLFDVTDENIDLDENSNKGLMSILKGKVDVDDIDFNKVSVHLGLAIDYQSRAADGKAAKELRKAIDYGLTFPAAYFNLGLLYHRLGKKEKAQPYFEQSKLDSEYELASHLLIADYFNDEDNYLDANRQYLRALKIADLSVVKPELFDILGEQYDRLIDSVSLDDDQETLAQLNKNIEELLIQTNWKHQVKQARSQLPSAITGTLVVSLAEILTQPESTEMVQTMSSVYQIARQGFYRSAMEEAYNILSVSPNYLPLHIYMGELLMRQNRTKEAIKKFTTVSTAYFTRGEERRGIELLRRIVDIVPLEVSVRHRLIKRLLSLDNVNDAIREYIKLAEVNYSLAKMDLARDTYESALIVAEEHQAEDSLKIEILHKIADIDLQRLDWREAVEVYKQICKINPEEEQARIQLIEVNLRLGEPVESNSELDSYLFYLSSNGNDDDAITFVNKIIDSNPEMLYARKCLAEIHQQIGQTKEAIVQWDKVAEKSVAKGEMEGAKEALRAILMLNPEDHNRYRTMLQRLG
ncbi:MAG: tetratricopeptide repeat protein [Chloroflexi bacterium]|jgi:tetratricopeptide (TPR) repeat protein|nr:tetratricopeptide repeat protein [Chloroflexota bacterium]MBT3669260.1 tetratricopeptide repeat protein [Chloroflexota bacterium]MBT4003085.1 tetratricopeptide repeat protein [Chloroflexota bacterium]MBT4305967.1 tetratricopeptide repeat protein [Chloroflexota bacterium]MBT4532611.1 tetratricopeptide repeat protein [Chloroflexota bacterium]